jgi:glycosyltransferase involved in cell wall biosynthesis
MSLNKQILVVAGGLTGGVGTALTNVFSEMDLANISVTFAVGRVSERSISVLQSRERVRIIAGGGRRTWQVLRVVVRELLRNKYDVVLLTGEQLAAIAFILIKCFRPNTRVIIRESMALNSHLGLMNWIERWAYKSIIKFSYRRVEAVIIPSIAMMPYLLKLGVSKVHIKHIPNPVNYKNIIALANQKSGLELPIDDGLRVVYCGRLERQKNIKILLSAIAKLSSWAKVSLLIIGDGTEFSALKSLAGRLHIESRVTFVPWQDNPYPILKICDVFVLPSNAEGFPNMLAEALLLGLKCVSTDCEAGPKEILQYGRLGSLVAVDDDDALANAIWREHLVTRSRASGIQRQISRWEPSIIAGRYKALLLKADNV